MSVWCRLLPARALLEIDQGRPIGPTSPRTGWPSTASAPLFGALCSWRRVVVSLLASSIFLIPIAVWLAGRWALIAPAIELENACRPLGALRRSGRLVRRRWLKVASLIVAGGALVVVAGPLIGALADPRDRTRRSGSSTSSRASSTPSTMPFVALATAYVYFDARIRGELRGRERARPTLPAEIELST